MSNMIKHNAGRRVKLVYTNDPYTNLRSGDTGTYQFALRMPDGKFQHSIEWDNGSTLMLIQGVDDFEFITEAKNDA